MNKFILMVALIGILFTGCKKEPCEKNKTGTVTIHNSASDPYKLEVNGIFITNISSGAQYSFTGHTGTLYNMVVTQLSGYLIFPAVKSDQLFVQQCGVISWTFFDK